MCHHYRGARQPPEHLADEFSLRTNLYQLVLPDEGFYPLAHTPIVRLDERGQREMVAAEWGFLPSWWKPSDKTPKRASFQRKCINARSEDVHQKPTYRDAFRRRRCLMPAEEFFERGHYFRRVDGRTFAFAAIWDRWRDDGGDVVETCALLTTEPNERVRAVGHNRMPVVLAAEDEYARWLDPEIVERPRLEELLRPTSAAAWECYAAQRAPATPGPARSGSNQQSEDRPEQGRLF